MQLLGLLILNWNWNIEFQLSKGEINRGQTPIKKANRGADQRRVLRKQA
jgi:hypothetical protein